MKKTAFLLAVLTVFVIAGCSAAAPEESASQSAQSSVLVPIETLTPPDGDLEPNVWVVKEDAPVMDADTGKEAGRAFVGFMLSVQNEKDDLAGFNLNFQEKAGENVAQTKNYTIDTKYMEKKYVEPQATILIISVDMITLKPGGSFYNEQGQKLITFNDAVGPFHFIQETENGYMMTIDFNVVYAKKDDVDFIPVPMTQ